MAKTKTYITPEQLAEAEENGVSAKNLYQRLYMGWDLQRAMGSPVHSTAPFDTEEMRPYIEQAEANGISLTVLRRRIRHRGWSIERAISEPLMTPEDALRQKGRKKPIRFTEDQKRLIERAGIKENTARQRIRQFGWSLEDALNVPSYRSGAKRKDTQ
jgi:uncharacterized protein YjcR